MTDKFFTTAAKEKSESVEYAREIVVDSSKWVEDIDAILEEIDERLQ